MRVLPLIRLVKQRTIQLIEVWHSIVLELGVVYV